MHSYLVFPSASKMAQERLHFAPRTSGQRLRRAALLALLNLLSALTLTAGTRVYLSLEEAPKAVFPEADSFERKDIQVSTSFRRQLEALIGRAKPSLWEPFYITYIARKQGSIIGYAVVCEEIGKHRPITFIVAVTPEGKVRDVAIMMYREPLGDEVRYKAFRKQFEGKSLSDPIEARKDIRIISGATLSSEALSRGVRKALAVVKLAYLNDQM